MYERVYPSVDSVMPDFTLKDESGRDLSLGEFKKDKKYVVLAIVRGVDDRHTRRQLEYLRNDYLRFQHYGGDVLVISYGSTAFNRDMIAKLRLPFHMLSDEDNRVLKMLGLYNKFDRLAGPAIYLLNRAGTILFMHQGNQPSDIIEDEAIIMAMQGDTQSPPDWPLHW